MIYDRLISFGSEICSSSKTPVRGISSRYMLHFVVNGSGYYKGRKLTAGQGFMARYGQLTEYYPDKDDPWTYAWVNFIDRDVLREVTDIIDFDGDDVFKFDVKLPYYQIITDMFSLKWGDNYNNTIISDIDENYLSTSALYIIMSYLKSDKICCKHNKNISVSENHVLAFERIVENDFYKENLTVQSISERLHISRAYLRNIFTKYRGISPQRYLLEYRMKKAAYYISSTKLPVGIIAVSVGYADQFQFSKLFKKCFGVSPKEYRNKKL